MTKEYFYVIPVNFHSISAELWALVVQVRNKEVFGMLKGWVIPQPGCLYSPRYTVS